MRLYWSNGMCHLCIIILYVILLPAATLLVSKIDCKTCVLVNVTLANFRGINNQSVNK